MPVARISIRLPGDRLTSHDLRTFAGFILLGFANVGLPFIIINAGYLIIPFSRPVVILINTLPALLVKILFPHLLHYVPRWTRMPFMSGCWIVAAIVTMVTPPNVEPPIRVLISMLASATAAAGDVCFLSQQRYYARGGLAGWGVGTAAGGILCSVMPYALTMGMGMALRGAVSYVFYVVATMLATYFIVLPPLTRSRSGLSNSSDMDNLENEDEHMSLLIQDPVSTSSKFSHHVRKNWNLVRPVARPYMLQLAIAFAAQSVVFPGISRALPTSSDFQPFTTFHAAYGLAFTFGNLCGRSSKMFMRALKLRPALNFACLGAALALANSVFLLTPSTTVVVTLVFLVGFFGGHIYIHTFAAATEAMGRESDANADFTLGVLGAGETSGALLGALIGAMLEAQLCGTDSGSGRRWCSTTG